MYQLTDIQENIQLIASAKNYGFEEKISQTCAGEDNKPKVYFASANPDLNSLFFVPPDSGKEELIPALNSIPKDASAFYIHCENGEVKDFTVVKGT
ncbi:MAG: hypothetical protein K0B11_04365 [Mariniphaga sp.]|nr:hypothetical protein [Mariniphaga sp.]